MRDNRGYMDKALSQTKQPTALERAAARHAARTPEQVEAIKHRWEKREKYVRLLNDPEYVNVQTNDKGAVRATHDGHNYVHDERDNQRFFGNYTKEDMEEFCVGNIFRMGHDVILRDEGRLLRLAETPASLDLDLDGKIMDIATITGQHCGSALTGKNEQLGRVKRQTGLESDCVCLYFHDPAMFSEEQFKRDVDWYKDKMTEWGVRQRIKHVYCVINGADDILIFDI